MLSSLRVGRKMWRLYNLFTDKFRCTCARVTLLYKIFIGKRGCPLSNVIKQGLGHVTIILHIGKYLHNFVLF